MVNIIIPVSRKTFLQKLFARLDLLECPPDTNLLCYVDGDLELYGIVRNYVMNSKFKERLCVYRKRGQAGTSSVRQRRQRISDIHNEIKKLINKCDFVFIIEDDTIVPTYALTRLLRVFSEHPYAGFVSGLELGRWGFTHIGAWKVDDAYQVNKISSIKESEGIEEVDAAGFYCCLIRRENYLDHFFKPFEDVLGPDVNFGIEMRKQGLKNYVDHSVRCAHLNLKGEITFLNSKIVEIIFTRNDEERFGWNQKSVL